MAESWLNIPSESDFSLINIPFGIVTYSGAPTPRVAVAVGDQALDLVVFSEYDGFSGLPDIQPYLHVFDESTLNSFAALGRPLHKIVRSYLHDVLVKDGPFRERLQDNAHLRSACLVPLASIGDYTDFYVGKHHAFNVGVLFRGPANALQPNYTHLPVGYHGRASSVVVSRTPVRRPWGQILDADKKTPIYRPSKRLDIELELGAFVCKPNRLGVPVPLVKAEDHLFGYVLLNDWSARDIQAWEYVPLGPFNAKNFASTISAWVVLADALEPFRTDGIENTSELQAYLKPADGSAKPVFDINLEVALQPAGSNSPSVISRSNGRHLLWSFSQMLAHHTVGGCPLNVGDLLGSGTISGPDDGMQGSLLELTAGGSKIMDVGGVERKFLEDGDEVVLRGWCENSNGQRLGFGECRGCILPAWPDGVAEE
ncbi:fumarylacetoacetase [Sporothrix brasiliensis 5110]|uniref:Fumarylacetoacetase n=1 Tax=Sporothrix brasiliensis 5110 TaxID=1398154 RepID=A0A0C2EWL6_9PEZI|nr:fumarylacetoacetase [Sporothrix brasiliensis 5110]KIH90979.1 fumarylacetoacetase [Sporothrix brasiliensis 5110]